MSFVAIFYAKKIANGAAVLRYMLSISCFLKHGITSRGIDWQHVAKVVFRRFFVKHVKNFVFFVKLCALMALFVKTFFENFVPLWLIFIQTLH